mmetsp:Transcript_30392/g.51382  ORF Transcript_30392/g.51382 Transcript_30392/m.51382 type:complete len:300 (+) Transcript_30392:141-1040(+)
MAQCITNIKQLLQQHRSRLLFVSFHSIMVLLLGVEVLSSSLPNVPEATNCHPVAYIQPPETEWNWTVPRTIINWSDSQDYQIIRKIGAGSFGSVFLASISTHTNTTSAATTTAVAAHNDTSTFTKHFKEGSETQYYALKKFKNGKKSRDKWHKMYREVLTSQAVCGHDSIILLVAVLRENWTGYPTLVFEYVPGDKTVDLFSIPDYKSSATNMPQWYDKSRNSNTAVVASQQQQQQQQQRGRWGRCIACVDRTWPRCRKWVILSTKWCLSSSCTAGMSPLLPTTSPRIPDLTCCPADLT